MMPKYLETKTRVNRRTGETETVKVEKEMNSDIKEIKRAKGFAEKTLRKIEKMKMESAPRKMPEIKYLPGAEPNQKQSRWTTCLQANALLEENGYSQWTGRGSKKNGTKEVEEAPSMGQVLSFLRKEKTKTKREQKKAEKVERMKENLKRKIKPKAPDAKF